MAIGAMASSLFMQSKCRSWRGGDSPCVRFRTVNSITGGQRVGCLVVLLLAPACASDKSIGLVSFDAGHDAPSSVVQDAPTGIADLSATPDLAWLPDVNVAPDLGPSADTASTVQADGRMSPDRASGLPDSASAPDRTTQVDTGLVVSEVGVITYKDYGTADSACLSGTATWIDNLTTYLAEDRRCFIDSDCQYVSFSNSCGQVCPVPMNVQRIGEFGQHAIGELDSICSSCPVPTDIPPCPALPVGAAVMCRNSVCSWR